eukprot:2553775-Pyramimonas_sp.AAC.1
MGPLKVSHWGQGRNLRRRPGVLCEPDTPVGKCRSRQPVYSPHAPSRARWQAGRLPCSIRP